MEFWEKIGQYFGTLNSEDSTLDIPLAILQTLLLLLLAYFGVRYVTRILYRFFKTREVDEGKQFAIIQFIRYFLFISIGLSILGAWHFDFIGIWAGSAALLVGLGFALQQTFNDILSGILILVEGTVAVGDVVVVEGEVGKVKSINLRTSSVVSRDNVTIIIPNHKLVLENAINWSHINKATRFSVKIGVAYGSDVNKVTALLLQAAREHHKVVATPSPHVHFKNFGDSSLDFILYFYSNELLGIEHVKSDIRYKIDKLFGDNNIEIPFPQQDVWLRGNNTI